MPVDDAVAEAGRRLRAIVDEHGPDAVALYVSGQMSIEAQYLATKLAKGFLRTVHIESNSRLCMASAGTGYKQSLGADGPPGSYADFDCTDLFFVIGSNMADCHPILYLRMADRLKAGAKLIVVDPRRTATAQQADLYLPIKPGTDLALLNGILHLLVESGDIDADFIAEHTEGWGDMPEFLADYPPERVAEITGIPEADIRTAARMIAEAGEWMSCWTMGLNQSTHGTWNTNAICNLHLATGAICRPGSGPMSLTGQPNAMGGREMGYMGPGLPGQRSVASAGDRDFVEQQWGLPAGPIRADVGPGTVDMFEQLAAGEIKACWIICTNPVATVANRQTVIAGLEAAELVITQDAYASTATNRYADIVLPAALWAEADAVMVNSERNLTLLAAAIPAAGDARPDWQLICQVAAHLGFGEHFDFSSSEQIFDEIRRFSNPATGYDLRGVSYARLRQTPLQWPCPPDDDADRHPIRYLNDGISQELFVDADGHRPRLAFPTPSRRAVFHARPHMEPRELPDDDFPLVLNTGRLQHQWHTMTKTGQGRQAQQAQRRALRRAASGGRGRNGHRRRPTGRAHVAPRPRRAACRRDRAGAAGQLLRAVPLERRTRRVPDRQRGDQRRRRRRLPAAGVQGVRGARQPGRAGTGRGGRPAVVDEGRGPLVLWASQTGNAEDFAARLARQAGRFAAGQHGRCAAVPPRDGPRRPDRHQHIRRRRPTRQRGGLLGSPRWAGRACARRRPLCRARHRRQVVCRLLWSREVDRREVRRPRRLQAA